MKPSPRSNGVRIQPAALRRWIAAGTIATTLVGGVLLLIFARLQAGKAVWTDGFYLNGSQWFDAARTTVTLVGIIGLGGAAFLAYRKQVSTEASHLLDQSTSLRDRYTTTAEQLGHDSSAIRLAGVYALASLADDWHDFGNDSERQVCVDLLCAYLRTRRQEATESSSGRDALSLDAAERNVRLAIVGSIRARTRTANKGWSDCVFDLSGASLDGVNLYRVNLKNAALAGATLTDALLSGANLSGANLLAVDLSGANLSGANLSGANLDAVNLSTANLSGANLSGANLSFANLDRCRYSRRTQWPDDFNPPSSSRLDPD